MRRVSYATSPGKRCTAGIKLSAETWIVIPPLVSVGVIVAATLAAVLPSLRARSSQ